MFGRGRLTCAPTSGAPQKRTARYKGRDTTATVLREAGSPLRTYLQRRLGPLSKPPAGTPTRTPLHASTRACFTSLPSHQLNAIHGFFNCLLLAQTDIHECSTCYERFHGIRMRHSQYDRCSSESARSHHHPLPFPSRSPTFSWRSIHRFPPQNMADLRDIPQDLHVTLEGLTCAASPLPAFSCGSARTANTGNIFIFSRDLVPLCTTLPRRRTSTYLSFKSRTRETPPPTV